MSKAERIKEELAWYRVVFTIVAAIDASLVAWQVQNFVTVRPVFLMLALLIACGLTVGLIWINRSVFRRLAELERL